MSNNVFEGFIMSIIAQHGLMSVKVGGGGGGGGDTVNIGGREYPIVQIGNQVWLAENLDFKFPGLVVGANGTSSSEPRANYYDNDESTYGVNGNKYGLLYNYEAVTYLNSHRTELIPGWHVPTYSECEELVGVVGGVSTAGTKLKSTTDWSSGAGTDDYGFSALPAGYYEGHFFAVCNKAYFYTDTVMYDASFFLYFDEGASVTLGGRQKTYQYSVRLVKDVQ